MNKSNSTLAFKGQILSSDGFTLLEILIAITILAFVSLAVVSITENAANTMQRTTEINENNLQIETALSRFEWDFTQIYSPLYFSTPLNMNPNRNPNDLDGDGNDDNTRMPITQVPGQPGMNQPMSPMLQDYYQRLIQRFEQNQHFSAVSKEGLPIPRFYSPEKNIFEFFTSSNRRKIENTKQSHFAWVRYALGEPVVNPNKEEDKENKIPPGLRTLVRYFEADDPYSSKRIDPNDTDRVKGAVLLENVESLEFQFWNMQNRKWETNLRAIPNGENVLRGVKMMITWYDSNGNKRTVSKIFRNHWPMVVPQDQASATASGAQGGATGAQGGGMNSGVNSGINGGGTPVGTPNAPGEEFD